MKPYSWAPMHTMHATLPEHLTEDFIHVWVGSPLSLLRIGSTEIVSSAFIGVREAVVCCPHFLESVLGSLFAAFVGMELQGELSIGLFQIYVCCITRDPKDFVVIFILVDLSNQAGDICCAPPRASRTTVSRPIRGSSLAFCARSRRRLRVSTGRSIPTEGLLRPCVTTVILQLALEVLLFAAIGIIHPGLVQDVFDLSHA
mmetsp:Transcript_27628/g.51517  ORF Transcript_27628/g.51517 Transcript_27628/m.51517 type:complete len:201 (+) Transcript_27628:318-920(+)